MQNSTLTGIALALGSGLMVGIQATLFTLMGRTIGPIRTSLVLNVTGGILAGAVVLGAVAVQGREQWNIPRPTVLQATAAVAMGMLIVAGVAFAFQRTGLAAGIATMFLGQMLIGVIVDSLGRAGGEAIPLEPRRILGLVIMGIAVFFLVPRQ